MSRWEDKADHYGSNWQFLTNTINQEPCFTEELIRAITLNVIGSYMNCYQLFGLEVENFIVSDAYRQLFRSYASVRYYLRIVHVLKVFYYRIPQQNYLSVRANVGFPDVY